MKILKRIKERRRLSTDDRAIFFHFRHHFSDPWDISHAMSILSVALCLIILTISSLQACQQTVNKEKRDDMRQNDFIQQLPPGVELVKDQINGTIRLLKGISLSTPLITNEDYHKAVLSGQPGEMALAFINAYRTFFKLQDPKSELTVSKVEADNLGMTHVRLSQNYKGFEVWPAEINVHFNQSSDVYLVQGHYAKTPADLSINPYLDESDALNVISKNMGIEIDELSKCRSNLIVYCGSSEAPKLAYRIYAELSADKAWHYIVDAQTGTILEIITAVQNQGGPLKPSTGKIILK
jgi:hypothetical protein